MNKLYKIERRKRIGGPEGHYFIWILSEYSLPDANGNYQRVKVIAEFGNSQRKENYQNAKRVKEAFEAAL